MNEFKFNSVEQPKCVIRIERDKIWVDPDIEVTEAARIVIASLEQHIKMLLAAEREKAAKVCEEIIASVITKPMPLKDIAAAIRSMK